MRVTRNATFEWCFSGGPILTHWNIRKMHIFGNNKYSALVKYVKWLEYSVERAKYITDDLVHIHTLTTLRSVNTFH